jgi:hypothetical protein
MMAVMVEAATSSSVALITLRLAVGIFGAVAVLGLLVLQATDAIEKRQKEILAELKRLADQKEKHEEWEKRELEEKEE